MFPDVYLIADDMTYLSLVGNGNISVLSLRGCNKFKILNLFSHYFCLNKPKFLLVESAWRGGGDCWRYKIANYSDYPERNNSDLIKVLEVADEFNIPAVFWNKEDGVHFERFIDSAKLFKYVLTVDVNAVALYKDRVNPSTKIGVLPFAFQPKFHFNSNEEPRYQSSLFMGSYSQHEHIDRRSWQTRIFPVADKFGLTIVDRNSKNKSENYRFPNLPNTAILPSVLYSETGNIYRQFSHCLNVNTVVNSPTMFSRRLIEIMACGRLAISNPSLSIDNLFEGMCETVDSAEQAFELLKQLSYGYTKEQKEMIRYATNHVHKQYTYDMWINKIIEFID